MVLGRDVSLFGGYDKEPVMAVEKKPRLQDKDNSLCAL